MSTPTRILYLSYDGMTDPLGQSQVLPYLIGLTREGYSFTVLSCEKPERYEKYKDRIAQICRDNNIKWVPQMYTKRPPVLSTVMDTIKMQRKANEIYQETPYQIVHARGHYITSLVARALQRKFGVKYIFDMRGFWADERIDGNLWKLSNPLYRTIYHFFKRKELEFLENADQVITLTEVAEKEIHSWTNIVNNPVPITVIPCCADMDTFSRSKVDHALQEKIKQNLGITSTDYIFLYLGSLGTWYMLDEMLDFFKVLHTQQPNAKLLFVTNDNKDNILSALQKKSIDLKYVMIVNSSFDDVPTYISLADSSIFFIKPVYSKKGSSPVKQGELMSMGVPIVCNGNVGDTAEIVHKYHSGVVVEDFTQESYEKAARQLLNTKFDPEAIVQGALDFFSVKGGVEKYLTVYKKVLNK
jgi:glycosyltransferase involved in cell wall biosynthesis